MRLTEENVKGQIYYTAKCNQNRPWNWPDVVDWCEDTFGPHTGKPGSTWFKNDIVKGGKLWFKEKEDLLFFMLRWS
jgi:hypothetical protein